MFAPTIFGIGRTFVIALPKIFLETEKALDIFDKART